MPDVDCAHKCWQRVVTRSINLLNGKTMRFEKLTESAIRKDHLVRPCLKMACFTAMKCKRVADAKPSVRQIGQ